jgi:hypothetical protein
MKISKSLSSIIIFNKTNLLKKMYKDNNWGIDYIDVAYNLHPTQFVIDKTTGSLIPRQLFHKKYKPKFHK